MPSLCSCHSSLFPRPGTTGAGELMPCRVAFQRTISLPSAVRGPPASLGTSSLSPSLLGVSVSSLDDPAQALGSPYLVPISGKRIVQLYPGGVLGPADTESAPAGLGEVTTLTSQQFQQTLLV